MVGNEPTENKVWATAMADEELVFVHDQTSVGNRRILGRTR